MKKNLLFFYVILTIFLLGCTTNQKKEPENDISKAVFYDFENVINNKELDKEKINASAKKVYDNYKSFVNKENREDFKKKLIDNSYLTVKLEWNRIKKYSISSYSISDPIPLEELNNSLVGQTETKAVIIRAFSEDKLKYIYIYLFALNPNTNNYEYTSLDLINNTNLVNSTKKLLSENELANYNWYNLSVK